MKEIVNRYARGEAGVRGLERKIGSVVRAKVVEWSDWTESRKEGDGNTDSIPYNPVVEQRDLERILGIAPWDASIGLAGEDGLGGRAGVVYGLVVMGQGEGGILPVETVMVPGEGKLRLTGMLGDVSRFSVVPLSLPPCPINLGCFFWLMNGTDRSDKNRLSKKVQNWR